MASQSTFPFLSLPPELREKIYIKAINSSRSINLNQLDSHPAYHSLLLTCTQIYHETRPLFFTTNAFMLTIRSNHPSTPFTILSPSSSFRDNLRQIRSLRLTLLRWGTKSFFLDELIPAVEDCILNGRLRILEIVVARRFLRALETEGNGGEERENWNAVRRVLGDQYLEVGKLLTAKVEMWKRDWLATWSTKEERELEDVSWMLWHRNWGVNGEPKADL